MDEFNKKFIDANPELDFVRFISAKIDADNDKVILSAVYDRSRGEEYAQSEKKVRAAAAGLFPPFANVSVVASPSVAGSRELLHTARDFLLKESAIVASAADGENISVLMGEPPSVTLVLTPAVAEYADHENVCPRLKEYIDTRMFSDVRVRVTVRDEDPAEITRTLNEKIYKPRFAYERPDEGRAIDPVGRTPMCGKLVEGEAKYICDCVEPEYVVIYGALLDLREREYTPRKPKEGETTRKFASFVLDDGTGTDRTILSGIREYYEPEELVGKTCVAITNLPPRKMMGIDSCGMLISAVCEYDGEEMLNLLMVDDKIPAGAKLY